MTLHLASSNEVRRIIRTESGSLDREATVKQMAEHLVAGVQGGLCTASDIDVIEYRRHTPEQYHSRTILDLMPAALYEAKQMLFAMEITRP